MRRLGLLALVLAAAAADAAAPAAAADIGVPPVAAAPAPVYRPAIYDWTGIYFGVHIGAGLLEDEFTQTAAVTENAGTRTVVNPYGLIGGVQAGANFEVAPWVVGVEGTWTPSYITGSAIASAPVLSAIQGTPLSERSTAVPHWYATFAGRLGYAANDLLIYAKGGAAFMQEEYTQDILSGATSFGANIQSMTEHRLGFVVGGGLEYGITENLSAKVEYDFLDFGTKNYTFGVLGSQLGTAPVPFSIKSATHMFTAGLNYRFNWNGGGFAPF